MKVCGNAPLNARVVVDYSKGRKVSFAYPLKDGLRQRMALTLQPFFLLWLAGNIALAYAWFIGAFIYALLTGQIAPAPVEAIDWNYLAWQSLLALALAAYMVGPPLLAAYLVAKDYHLYAEVFPKLNYRLIRLVAGVRRTEVGKIDGRVFELPAFHNVYMEYRAAGDFARLLEKVEVREHDFKIVKKVKGEEVLRPHDGLWKAVFTFKEAPKGGKLTVDFL